MTTNVDLAELNEERGAHISYWDAYFLIQLQDFLSRQRGGEGIYSSPDALAEKLAALYPEVTFTRAEGEPRAYAAVIAEVKPESGATLKEALGVAFLIPDDARGTLYEDRHGLRAIHRLEEGHAVFCPGRFGYIEDGDTQFFTHTLDIAELRDEAGGDEDVIEENLSQYFSEELNHLLDDPYIEPGDLEDQEVYFVKGSEEELERLVQLFVLTEPDIEGSAGDYVCIRTSTEDEGAYLDGDGDGYYSERLNRLVELALESHEPEGWTWEYNDGAVNQKSGYDVTSSSITYDIEEILELPARVRMAARRDLKLWLESQGSKIEGFDAEPFVEATEEDTSLPAAEEGQQAAADEGDPVGAATREEEEDEVLFPTVRLNFTPKSEQAQASE